MRWHVGAFVVLLALALTETSLLPAALGGGLRPGLVLIATSVWVALRGMDGLFWVFLGGFMLDLTSNLPVGLTSLSLLLGNVVATIVDRAPIPSATVRASTWVALVTVVSYGLSIAGMAISGLDVDVVYAMTNVILPLLVINPALAVIAHAALNQVNLRQRRREAGRTIAL